MAATENRSTFGGLIKGVEASFMDVFDHTTADYKSGWGQLAKEISSQKERERFTGVAGPGNLARKTEGASFTQASRIKTYNTEFTPISYGKEIVCTHEEIMDQDWKQKLDAAEHLTRRGMTTKDQHFWMNFNNAFSVTDILADFPISRYGDAVPMCSTIHPRVDGGTAQSNASAVGLTLTEGHLNTLYLQLMSQLEDDGTPIDTSGRPILVVPLDLEKTALEIVKSDLKSGTANNDMNYYKGANFDVVTSKYLGAAFNGSATQWFIIMPTISKILVVNRESLTANTDVEKKTLNVSYSVFSRWATGYWDWRGIVGSKGDGSAYSS